MSGRADESVIESPKDHIASPNVSEVCGLRLGQGSRGVQGARGGQGGRGGLGRAYFLYGCGVGSDEGPRVVGSGIV